MPLKVTVTKKEPGVFIISPVGSIDANTYMIFKKEVDPVLQTSPKVIIFNMEGVTYINTMGITVIVETKKALSQKKGTSMMVNLQPQIKKVFDIVKVLSKEAIFTTMKELDNYLATVQQKDIEERKSR